MQKVKEIEMKSAITPELYVKKTVTEIEKLPEGICRMCEKFDRTGKGAEEVKEHFIKCCVDTIVADFMAK